MKPAAIILLVLLAMPNVVSADVLAGVEVEGSNAPAIPTPVAPDVAEPRMPLPGTQSPESDVVVFIDFDDVVAPMLFNEAVPLTTEYQDVFVVFEGPAVNEGGSVLDQTSNFGVTGFSPPNFLAFNSGSLNSLGGVPQGPETLTFDPLIQDIQILAGICSTCGDAGDLTIECYNTNNVLVGSDTITGSGTMQLLHVSTSKMQRCELSFTSSTAVFDDLQFFTNEVSADIPTLGGKALMMLAAVLALSALGVLRTRHASR